MFSVQRVTSVFINTPVSLVPTDDLSVSIIEAIVTDCAPFAILEDLNSSFECSGSVTQPYLVATERWKREERTYIVSDRS